MPDLTTNLERVVERSGLGRSVDPRDRNIRRVIIGSGVAGGIVLIHRLTQDGFQSGTVLTAVGACAAVFLAWAVGREIDPDRPVSAEVAMVLAFFSFFGGQPSLGVAAIALLAVRIAVGTVGRPLAVLDGVVLIGVGAYGGLVPEAWPAVIALVLVVGWDRSLPFVFTLCIAGAGFATALVSDPEVTRTFGTLSGLAVAASLLAALVRVPPIAASPDSGTGIIHPARVMVGRIIVAVIAATATMLAPDGAWAMAPLIAALVGVGVVSILRPVPVG